VNGIDRGQICFKSAAMAHRRETSADTNTPGQFRYWAFISYSHRDAEWARWLHRKLETYRIPEEWLGTRVADRTIPRRLHPIFRDRDELPSAGSLNDRIREALAASHALIVICSPSAATSLWVNEEVRAFKALGRTRWICPLIVEGEPHASDHPDLRLPECLPPALRFDVAADGTLSNQRSDPLAGDAREGKDGRSDACLKLIAGVLGIGFDDLRRRDLVRRRRRQLFGALLSSAILLLLGAGYVATADADFDVPGGTEIRRQFDRYGASIFRRVPSRRDMAQKLSETRRHYRQFVVDVVAQGKLTSEPSIWSRAQVAAAIYRDPEASNDDIRLLTPLLDQLFAGDIPRKVGGRPIGWGGDLSPRVETVFWVMMALTHALRREEPENDAIHTRYARYLDIVQEMTEPYYPLQDGGWNAVISEKPEDHSIYSSALALHALLELRSAGRCWKGDCQRLAAMIDDTSRWLVRAFVAEKSLVGWRIAASEETAPIPDLSLFVHGILGRPRMPTPDVVQQAALQQLVDLRLRPYHPAHFDLAYYTAYDNGRGQSETAIVRTRVFWYPWAIEALGHWLRRADTGEFSPDIKRALERSLGNAVVANANAAVGDIARVSLFATAETYYGLGGGIP
jgi:hypothetical protein